MIEDNNTSQGHFGLIYEYVDGFLAREISRSGVLNAIWAHGPDPTRPTAWADLNDCLTKVLARLTAGNLTPAEATLLILRILAAA